MGSEQVLDVVMQRHIFTSERPFATVLDGRRLVRLIAGNPVTMGQMTRHVPDAGSYAPVPAAAAG